MPTETARRCAYDYDPELVWCSQCGGWQVRVPEAERGPIEDDGKEICEIESIRDGEWVVEASLLATCDRAIELALQMVVAEKLEGIRDDLQTLRAEMVNQVNAPEAEEVPDAD